jgi:hypothetical protein
VVRRCSWRPGCPPKALLLPHPPQVLLSFLGPAPPAVPWPCLWLAGQLASRMSTRGTPCRSSQPLLRCATGGTAGTVFTWGGELNWSTPDGQGGLKKKDHHKGCLALGDTTGRLLPTAVTAAGLEGCIKQVGAPRSSSGQQCTCLGTWCTHARLSTTIGHAHHRPRYQLAEHGWNLDVVEVCAVAGRILWQAEGSG